MILISIPDRWTNRPDYVWTSDSGENFVSPFFASREEAIRWKEENSSDDES